MAGRADMKTKRQRPRATHGEVREVVMQPEPWMDNPQNGIRVLEVIEDYQGSGETRVRVAIRKGVCPCYICGHEYKENCAPEGSEHLECGPDCNDCCSSCT